MHTGRTYFGGASGKNLKDQFLSTGAIIFIRKEIRLYEFVFGYCYYPQNIEDINYFYTNTLSNNCLLII